MAIFVTQETRPIAVGANTVHVRAGGFTYRESQQLQRLAQSLADDPAASLEPILQFLVVRWEGPDFDGVPCDAEHLAQLNVLDAGFSELMAAIKDVIVPK